MRRKYFLIAALVAALTLPACTKRRAPAPVMHEPGIVDRELKRSRAEILSRLSELQDASVPQPPYFPETRTLAIDLQHPLRLVWEGPLDQGLASVATRIGWKAKRFGGKPVHDIIVFCESDDTGAEILEKFQAQAGNRARITVDEAAKLIKVTYGSDIPKGKYRHTRRAVKPRKPIRVNARPGREAVKVPSTHKPTIPADPGAQVRPETSVRPSVPKVEIEKATSDIVTRTRPHKTDRAEMIDQAF